MCLMVNVVSIAPAGGNPVAAKRTTGRLFVSTETPGAAASNRCRISSPASMTPAVPAGSTKTSQPLFQSLAVPVRHTSVVGPVLAHTAVGRPRFTASLRAALSATTSSFVLATTRLLRIICVNDGTPRASRMPRTATAAISSSRLKPCWKRVFMGAEPAQRCNQGQSQPTGGAMARTDGCGVNITTRAQFTFRDRDALHSSAGGPLQPWQAEGAGWWRRRESNPRP